MSRLALALACLALSPLAQAATFVVDTTSDAVLDRCDIDTLADCSLRGAITAANAITGPHAINFGLHAPILGNNFHDNRGVAINLTAGTAINGPTPNNIHDSDEGGNRMQNTVELLSLAEDVASDQLRLSVRVDSTPTAASIRLFSATACSTPLPIPD